MKALLVAAFVLVASPAFAASLQASIEAQNANWMKAYNGGDAQALAELYAPDAAALPPGAPMASGRAEIQKLWQGAMQAGVKNISLHTLSVRGCGGVASEIGRFTLDAPDANGAIKHVQGKYVVLWEQTSGGWMLQTDIWNLD